MPGLVALARSRRVVRSLGLHSRRHPQGTEIKAITYSNMQIHEKEGRADIYVIVDI